MNINNEILKSNLKRFSTSKDLKNKDRELYKCVLNLFMVSTVLIKYETLLNSKGFENSIGAYVLKHLNNILKVQDNNIIILMIFIIRLFKDCLHVNHFNHKV